MRQFFTGYPFQGRLAIGAAIIFAFFLIYTPLFVAAQSPCVSGTVYGVNGNALTITSGTTSTTIGAQQGLFTIDPATDTPTLVAANIFGGGAAANSPHKGTSALAVDPRTNTFWFSSRNSTPYIFSYTPGATTPFGSTSATYTNLTGDQNINKGAYNPVDHKIYFHNGSNNHLYSFNPATPTVAAVDLGALSITQPTSVTDVAEFQGGDMAFDGLGNLTGSFYNNTDPTTGRLAIFPAQYAADGSYLGLSLAGQKAITLSSAAASVSFLLDGNYIVGGGTGSRIVNTNTGTDTDITPGNFATSDNASCAAPAPNLIVQKTATSTCSGTSAGVNIKYTITVQNTGQFHAINTRLIDALPSGVTLQSATLNGQPIANTSTLATTGILIRSTTATTDGQVFKGETATIVLNCTAPQTVATYSNQAFVKYNGVESKNLPNDQVPSDNPATAAANDATPVTTTACFSISGNVLNDANGLNDGNVNGTGTNAGGLYAVLVDGTNTVVSSVTVAANGTYSFPSYPSGNYSVRISTTSGGAVSLPTGWVSTGEDCCDNVGNDGTVDGTTSFTVGNSNVTNVNFGIEQRPVAGSGTNTVANAGGTTPVTVPANTFTNTANSTDTAPGSVTGIVVTAFPSNTTSLTINGTVYTASNFPAGGVVVPTDGNGQPTVPISVDPTNDANPVSISFQAIDNAGVRSSNTGTATLNFIIPPDLTPIIQALPNVVYGTKAIAIVVNLFELRNVATSGLITVRVTKDSKAPLSFNSGDVSVNGQTVNNSVWSFDGTSSPDYYILTTNQVISGGGKLSFGLTGSLIPDATQGTLTITSVIVGGSGNEARINNNVDAEKIDYFAQ